jgi:23S rRNA pseudoU1915 N3-methylase RlmH
MRSSAVSSSKLSAEATELAHDGQADVDTFVAGDAGISPNHMMG